MTGPPPDGPGARSPAKDDGLRRVLTWTLVALVVSLAMAAVGARHGHRDALDARGALRVNRPGIRGGCLV